MLAMRLHKFEIIVLEDREAKKPVAQFLINERSRLDFVDICVDAPWPYRIYTKKISGKVEKIGES
jgi:hypothetical protein